jgi:hypothetical protein
MWLVLWHECVGGIFKSIFNPITVCNNCVSRLVWLRCYVSTHGRQVAVCGTCLRGGILYAHMHLTRTYMHVFEQMYRREREVRYRTEFYGTFYLVYRGSG